MFSGFSEGSFVKYRNPTESLHSQYRERLIFSKVAKITKTQIILENGQKFAISGKLWGASYGGNVPPRLMHTTPEEADKYLAELRRDYARLAVEELAKQKAILLKLGDFSYSNRLEGIRQDIIKAFNINLVEKEKNGG